VSYLRFEIALRDGRKDFLRMIVSISIELCLKFVYMYIALIQILSRMRNEYLNMSCSSLMLIYVFA